MDNSSSVGISRQMQHAVDVLLGSSVDGFLAAASSSWGVVVVVVLEDFLLLLLLLEGCFLESSLLSLLLL